VSYTPVSSHHRSPRTAHQLPAGMWEAGNSQRKESAARHVGSLPSGVPVLLRADGQRQDTHHAGGPIAGQLRPITARHHPSRHRQGGRSLQGWAVPADPNLVFAESLECSDRCLTHPIQRGGAQAPAEGFTPCAHLAPYPAANAKKGWTYDMSASYVEIYNEQVQYSTAPKSRNKMKIPRPWPLNRRSYLIYPIP